MVEKNRRVILAAKAKGSLDLLIYIAIVIIDEISLLAVVFVAVDIECLR